MRRAVVFDVAATVTLVVALGISAWNAALLWQGTRDNARVAALEAGQDLAVPDSDTGFAQAARARFLALHGRMAQAEAIPDKITNPAARASLLYAIGNAHMHRALDSFKTDPMRVVAPIINLAKSEYRQALQIDPQNWDARWNYDIAAALVRDSDSAPPAKGDEMARERALWPNVPGVPNGLP